MNTRLLLTSIGVTTITLSVEAFSESKPRLKRIEEIVVTAQKTSELIQEVPQAVNAFEDNRLDKLQISKAQDIQFFVPNLTYSDTGTGVPNFTFRGVGSTSLVDGADVGVGVHINDVYVNSGSLGGALFDIEQVMVLRGPQGTLYGRNSTGGALNIITKRPASEFEGYAEASLASFDRKHVEGAFSLPISEAVRLRLAAFYTESDGYTKNEFTGNFINGDDVYIIRPTLSIDIGNTSLDIIASYLSSDADTLGFDKVACARDDTTALGCLPDRLGNDAPHFLATIGGVGLSVTDIVDRDPYLGTPIPTDSFSTYIDLEPQARDELADLTVELHHSFDKLAFTSLTSALNQRSYSLRDSDNLVGSVDFNTPISLSKRSDDLTGSFGGHVFGVFQRAFGYDEQFSKERQYLQEFRLQSESEGAHNFLLGAAYIKTDLQSRVLHATTGLEAYALFLEAAELPVIPPYIYNETDRGNIESLAGFGEYYYQFDDEVKFTLGLRWTRDEKRIAQRALSFEVLPGESLPGFETPGEGIDRAVRFDEITGRIGLNWTPDLAFTDHTMLYAFASRGYRAGGINDANSLKEDTYQPEIVHAIELGAKNSFLEWSGQANLTAFFYDYNDYQVFERGMFNVDARIWGVEAEFLQYFTENFSMDLNFSYLNAKTIEGAEINPRDPTAGNTDFVVVGDIEGANCIVDRTTFETPLAEGGFGGDPFALAKQFQLCGEVGLPRGLPTTLDGKELPNAPRWTANLGIQYQYDLTHTYTLLARADYYWQTSFYGTLFNNGADEVDSWKVLNLFAEVSPKTASGYYLRLGVTNLLNKDFITGVEPRQESAGLATDLFLLEPRAVTASVGIKF